MPCLFILQSAYQYRCKYAPLAALTHGPTSKISVPSLWLNGTRLPSLIQLSDLGNGSVFNFDRPPTGDVHICDNIVHFNEDMITVSPVATSVAVFLILASNGLMIVIANVDKNPYVISLCHHTKLIRYL